jgi:hypothetical protein
VFYFKKKRGKINNEFDNLIKKKEATGQNNDQMIGRTVALFSLPL